MTDSASTTARPGRYARLGERLYLAATAAEARRSGLQKRQLAVGELSMSLYERGPADASETILLLHGYSADKDNWPRFARALPKHYRLLIPDLAGHGETGFDPALNYGMPAQADRLVQLLDALGVRRVHVIGNSMGGFVAAHFGLRHADRCASVALINSAGVNSPQPSALDKLLDQGRNPFLVRSRADFDAFYAMTMAKPPWLPGVIKAALAVRYQRRRPELAQIFDDFYQTNMLDNELAGMRMPVLLLWGAEDQIIDISAAEVWAAGLPNATLERWPGIGHMPMVEVPERSAMRYAEFLSALPDS